MKRSFLLLSLFLLGSIRGAVPVLAGPNAGGTLIVHDVQTALYSISPTDPLCEAGTDPASCEEAIVRIDGAGPPPEEEPAIFKVYAAFPEGSAPRLMGVCWGIDYPSGSLALSDRWEGCGEWELHDTNWPASGSGCTVTWFSPATERLVPIYAFAAYVLGPSAFALGPHPSQGGWFGDDSVPAVLDAIAGYSTMGFDMPGELVCPPPAPAGACCQPDGSCTVGQPVDCPSPGIWHEEWMLCEPNPCPPPPIGACCSPAGDCALTLEEDCPLPDSWHEEWTTCAPNPCPPPQGACCHHDGSCVVTSEDGCSAPGVWHGEWPACVPNPCPPPAACCYPDGSCEFVVEEYCIENGGVWQGEGSDCWPNPCPPPPPPSGACCSPEFSCAITFEADCLPPSVWFPQWTSCEPNPCPALGACCAIDGTCQMSAQADCLPPREWHPEWLSCEAASCPPAGACCYSDGSCISLWESLCLEGGGTWQGAGVSCEPNPCPPPTGVCCALNGSCAITSEAECPPPSVWHPDWTSCDPNPCPQPGACCSPSTGACTIALEEDCPPPWIWHGEWTSCVPNPCPPPPPLGACCTNTGDCTVTTSDGCPPPNSWHEDWDCNPNPCPGGEGSNAGGTLIVHDVGLTLSGTDGAISLCLQGDVPDLCVTADPEIDGADPLDPSIFRVYAAFASWASPRLMGVTWGVDYDAALLTITDYGMCGTFELNDAGWPSPDTGSSVTWSTVQTDHLIPIYWFAAYNNGSSAAFHLGPNPTQGGFFGDDDVPANLDPIEGYSTMGFDAPGVLVCPTTAVFGACCQEDGSCSMTNFDDCPPPGVWHPEFVGCEPNPCPQPPSTSGACCLMETGECIIAEEPDCESEGGIWLGPDFPCEPNPCPLPVPVERSSWGRIKNSYR